MSNLVGLLYDENTNAIQSQVARDIMALAIDHPNMEVLSSDFDWLVEGLGVKVVAAGTPSLYIRYKTGKDWPPKPDTGIVVDRDLVPEKSETLLHQDDQAVGYFLKPQGRDGRNLTNLYLNRIGPKTRGIVDPLLVMLWG